MILLMFGSFDNVCIQRLQGNSLNQSTADATYTSEYANYTSNLNGTETIANIGTKYTITAASLFLWTGTLQVNHQIILSIDLVDKINLKTFGCFQLQIVCCGLKVCRNQVVNTDRNCFGRCLHCHSLCQHSCFRLDSTIVFSKFYSH